MNLSWNMEKSIKTDFFSYDTKRAVLTESFFDILIYKK
jgi:hypothetical protein